MESQKILNLLDNTSNQLSKFKTKIGLKLMMIHEEHITQIAKLNLRQQC